MSLTPFELFLSKEVLALIDNFANVLDVRVTFFSSDGREAARGRQMRNSDFCDITQRELGTLGECVSMDASKRSEAVQKNSVVEYRCHAGLREAIAPVMIRGELAGFLMIGQYRIDDEVPEHMIRKCADESAREQLRKAFFALPRISPEKLEDVLGLFKMLIDYIAVRELAVLRGDRLRHDIDRYLELHCGEDIHLPDMARKLGRSVSTISQFLRRNYHTGFKELLIKCRLDRAEEFWRNNPDATVGEAAFAAGFRDQFYFSRVFSQRRGMPPGKYRDAMRHGEKRS